jgi:hypothetical protein
MLQGTMAWGLHTVGRLYCEARLLGLLLIWPTGPDSVMDAEMRSGLFEKGQN